MTENLIKLNLELLESSTMKVKDIKKVQKLITELNNMLQPSEKNDNGLESLWTEE